MSPKLPANDHVVSTAIAWHPKGEAKLRRRLAFRPTSMMLESGPGFGDLGRWSIFLFDPVATFSARGSSWRLEGDVRFWDRASLSRDLNPLEALRRLVNLGRRTYDAGLDILEKNPRFRRRPELPFHGGWVGVVGYDFATQLERLPKRHGPPTLPDMYWAYCDRPIIIDRRQGLLHWFNDALIHRPSAWSNDSPSWPSHVLPLAMSPLHADWTKDEYLRAVARTIEYIGAGDIFQANITQRFSTKLHPYPQNPGRITALWERCVELSPAPFSALIKTPDWSILSTSPERFLLVEPDGRVETRPIKGTRPRGKSAKEDLAQMTELLSSAKDRAELAMIVDLERNDLGRVCKFGSVKVSQHAALESYTNVHHLVSVVEGRLREGCDVIDLLAAAFPGGSVTGAPKIRAMEIIDELEACSRGVYTGAIGYISDHGRADFNIAIRTLVVEGDHAHFHVGGGVTADSDPEAEYEETLAKGTKLTQILCSSE